jgi:hypothetical protein
MIVKPHITMIYFPVEPGQRLVWAESGRLRQTALGQERTKVKDKEA